MEIKVHRNKIGARFLTDREAEMILPTYGQIQAQIDQFRREKQDVSKMDDSEKDKNLKKTDLDQKTNNIGIMGVRGAGKTSILKTIRTKLEQKNKEMEEKENKKRKDIILPIIVPENMSESSTLMAAILGLLSDHIGDMEERQDQFRKDQGCIRHSKCRECCEEAIKQYTYIQNEYRNILLHEYTSENDYVTRSAKVFNSDSEFIYKFNELVDRLVNYGAENDSMIFVFIDDIDLSTYRCTDVTKTLLSYLSNKNIITFISGDLNTFEEALTLDFLRQEQVLNSDMLEKQMGSKNVLESKKLLAYEYLKKILPPVYRHNIKHWSLEEKAKYCVVDSGKEEAVKTFAFLLREALRDWVDPAFFSFAEVKAEERIQADTHIFYEDRVLPYTYHLFDDTSRGLNNVYNVLFDIAVGREGNGYGEKAGENKEGMKKDREKWELEKKKLLLDTMVASKPVYNRYREEILKRMFTVGTDRESSRVFFENAETIIYGPKEPEKEPEKETGKGSKSRTETDAQPKKESQASEATDRFSLFLLVDFAARLLYEEKYGDVVREENYERLKQAAMKDLFRFPIIAEKVKKAPENFDWDRQEKNKTREDITLPLLNKNFLTKGDLVLNLVYYRNILLDEMLRMYTGKKEEEPSAGLKQNTMMAVWKAFVSVAARREDNGAGGTIGADCIQKALSEAYPVFWKEFAYIQNSLSSSAVQNVVLRMFGEECDEVFKKQKTEEDEEQMDQQQIQKRKRILLNTIADFLKVKKEGKIEEEIITEEKIQEKWQDVPLDVCRAPEADIREEKNTDTLKRRIEVLKAIHAGNLWREEVALTAVDYVKNTVIEQLDNIQRGFTEGKSSPWRVDTASAAESWDVFFKAYAGVSRTLFQKTKKSINDIFDRYDFASKDKILFEHYDEILCKLKDLADNNRVWYGQSEAQSMLNKLQEAYAVWENPETRRYDPESGNCPYFTFLCQCLYRYKTAVGLGKDNGAGGFVMARVRQDIEKAHANADRQALTDFIAALNQELKKENAQDNISMDEFGRLFYS